MHLYPVQIERQVDWTLGQQPIFFMTDFILVPIFIYIIHTYFKKYIKDKPDYYQEYFMKAWNVRLVGCILTALMYSFYYKFFIFI